jgi:HlyD family secretion protein
MFVSSMKNIFPWFRRHWLLSLIGLVAFGGGVYFMKQEDASQIAATRVQIETVKEGDIKVVVSGSGQIEASAQVDLKPVAAGEAIEVASVLVNNDQEVKKGQVIAVLDSEDATRSVQQAELSLRSAQIKMRQTKQDFPKKTLDDMLARQVQETAVRQQELSLANARAKLADYTIKAPFDGIVTGLSVESGDTISQTGILASVITRNMKAVISLNEVDAAKVRVGNTVRLSFDALPSVTLPGKVSKLNTIGVAQQGVVSYGAEIVLDEQSELLKPGMSVTAEISVEEKMSVLTVPNTALTYEDGKIYVRVVSSRRTENEDAANPKAAGVPHGEKREIVVGITDDVNTEVVRGLVAGDRVVFSGMGVGESQVTQSGRSQGQTTFSGSLFRGGGTGGANFRFR